MSSPLAITSRHLRRLALGLPALFLIAASVHAEDNMRSSFPGRRVGGGTRGDCTARLVAHLVPASSVYAPGSPATIGVLEGPSTTPRPLVVEFRPLGGSVATTAGAGSSGATRKVFPPSPVGVTLLSAPAVAPATVWESSFQCDESADPDNPIAFVSSAAPPARTLLVKDVTPADRSTQDELRRLRGACGAAVDRAVVARSFALADLLTSDWPERIPVRCP